MRLSARSLRPLVCIASLAGVILATGCATTVLPFEQAQTPATAERQPVPTLGAVTPADSVPVFRHGRYTLVELVPEGAQRDLMQHVVEVTITPEFNSSVGDGMRHVLQRTGYRLCETQDAAALYALPLPAAHLRLGPLMLRDALRVLAGPAWKLSVDDVGREVCFRRMAVSGSWPPLQM